MRKKKVLTNQSRENSMVVMDIPVSRAVGLEKGEAIRRPLPELRDAAVSVKTPLFLYTVGKRRMY